MKTNLMSTAKALQSWRKAARHESKSIYTMAASIIRAPRPAELAKLFTAAGVPQTDCSNTAAKKWTAERLLPLMPAVEYNGRRVVVGFSTSRGRALEFTEGATPSDAEMYNITGVQVEYGTTLSADDKRRRAWLFIEMPKKNGEGVKKYLTDCNDEAACGRVLAVFESIIGITTDKAHLMDKLARKDAREAAKAALARTKQSAKTNTRTKASKQINK